MPLPPEKRKAVDWGIYWMEMVGDEKAFIL